MDLEQKYKEETGFAIGKIHDIGTTYYSDDYVKWLEEQLTITVVSQQRELLLDFLLWRDKTWGLREDIENNKDQIEDYLKSNNCG